MTKHWEGPAPIGIEKELFDALDRLLIQKPNVPHLQRKLKAGRLRINPTNVALEAGRARTLIAHEQCAYPRVRKAIAKNNNPDARIPTSFEELNDNLRQENSALKESVKMAMSRVAAMMVRMNAVETKASRKVAEAERVLADDEPKAAPEEIIGRKLSTQKPNVVSITRGRKRKSNFHA
jgi:hypothetical protein